MENTQGVSRRISVTQSKLRELMTQFRQNEARTPSHAELTKLADDWVHDEVLYREGLLSAVDRNDPVIRKRVVQLMQWYLVGAGKGGEPSEKELRDHFEASQERYRTGAGLVFEQVFFSTARRGPTAETDARMTMRSFESGKQTGIEVAIGHVHLEVAGQTLEREAAVFADGACEIAFCAQGDCAFLLGSALRHPYPLVLGSHSVHTSREALERGTQRIAQLRPL